MAKTTRRSSVSEYIQITDESGLSARVKTFVLVDPATGEAYTAGAPPNQTGAFVNQTAGAAFAALTDTACGEVELINTRPGAVDIEVRRGGSGGTVCVPAGGSQAFPVVANANELQIKRWDAVATNVTISAEVRS